MATAILSKNFKRLAFFATVLVVSLALGNFVFAVWNEPSAAPPDNNVSAPINVSGFAQTKEGNLSVPTLYDTNNPSYFIDPDAPISGVFAGKVGIGTTNPHAQLQLEGDSGSAAEIALVHKGVGGSAGINFNVTNDADSFAIKAHDNRLGFYTLNPPTRRMTILPNGNVGIGINPPGAKLDVNGTIKGSDYRSGDGSQGLTHTVTVKGSDGNNCTLTFKDGLLTAETCP